MFTIRRSQDRGFADHGWLKTHYTFSFANYYDPRFTGFRDLVVINEDVIAPHSGFGTHGHENMEILTWIIEGELTHRDSLGSAGVIRANEAQVMSAGTGVRHSEQNESDQSVHLLQIWLEPAKHHVTPRYDQAVFLPEKRAKDWCCIASASGEAGSLLIGQDVRVLVRSLKPGNSANYTFASNRHGWLQIIQGSVQLGDELLIAGDGVAISDEQVLEIQAQAQAEVLLFDLR